MDFIKKLFPLNSFTNYSMTNDQYILSRINQPNQNLIEIIEEQIKTLININLSPLPNGKEDIYIQQNEISSCLRKMVFYVDIIMNYKLKNPENIEIHYWNIIPKYFPTPSVKFIETIYSSKLKSQAEKGLAWILISLMENSLKESFSELYKKNLDIKYYQKDSFIIKNKYDILNILDNLSRLIILFNTNNLSIFRDYIQYKTNKEILKPEKNEFIKSYKTDMLAGVSPIRNLSKRKISSEGYGNLTSPSNLQIINFNNLISININGENFKSNNYNNNDDFFSNNKKDKNELRTLDNIMNLINNENTILIEENPHFIEDYHENLNQYSSEDDEGLKKKLPFKKSIESKNFTVEMKNIHAMRVDRIGKILYDEDKARKRFLNERYKIQKILDFGVCYFENYFSFENKNKINPEYLRKSSLWDINNQTISQIKISRDRSHKNYPFEKNIKIVKKYEKNKFSHRDIVYVKSRQTFMTNSFVFYLNNYFDKGGYYRFNTDTSKNQRPMDLKLQNSQCQICRKLFKHICYFYLEKIYWCSYYNKYICGNCVSEEFSILPSFVFNQWNFSKFSISKEAKALLSKWYDKPVICIKTSDSLLRFSSQFRTAAVLKRKIHKIFDLMKCEKYDKISLQILEKYNYFVLKENIFSLKDLLDINSGKLIKKLRDFLDLFEKHILVECKVCNYKGSTCMMCLSDDILMAYSIESVFYCPDCKKMFHKKCSQFHPCYINRIEI